MNIEEIRDKFSNIIFENNDLDHFFETLKIKGIERYYEIYNSLMETTNNTKIEYNKFTYYYRYDIKLRRILYKIISFIEIAMRSVITNNYFIKNITKSDFETQFDNCFIKKLTLSNGQRIKFKKIIGKETDLYQFIEKSDFEILNKVFLLVDDEYINEVFIYNDHLEENLDALRIIRNAVMHNYILITKDLNDVYINGENKGNSLQVNIENIINLSPDMAKNNLKKLINSCLIIDETKENTKDNNYELLDGYKVYFEGVSDDE